MATLVECLADFGVGLLVMQREAQSAANGAAERQRWRSGNSESNGIAA